MEIEVKDEVGVSHSVSFSDPDYCPVCHLSIRPVYVTSVLRDSVLQVVYECPNDMCKRLFLAIFEEGATQHGRVFYDLDRLDPETAEELVLPVQVKTLSPRHARIMEQVSFAEKLGLDELVGVGMRKALEFLVKDYAVHKAPDKEDEIKEKSLGNCIGCYLDDQRIRACAERATWLGNDETHYVRKWNDKDVQDLRVLIKLTQNWIDNDLVYEHYIAEMPKGKR